MDGFSGTRRDVLRRGAAAIGVATIAGSAGCAGILGGDGGDYTEWLPDPETHGDDDGRYSFSISRLSSLARHEDVFDDTTRFEEREQLWEPADIDWDEVEGVVGFKGVHVLEADFEKADVVSDFEDADYEADDEYEDYTLMLGSNEPLTAAVGDGVLVFTRARHSGTDSPAETVKRFIDTKNGEEERYTEENDDLGEVMAELGDGNSVFVYTRELREESEGERGLFEKLVAWGTQTSVNGEQSDGRWVWVFDTEDDADVGEIEEWMASERAMWDDVEVTERGRAVVVEATGDTAELYSSN